MLAEVGMGARWRPAVGSASHRDPGFPVPSIEEDFDPLLLVVEGGQSLEQLRLIARDDDETARHVAGPQVLVKKRGRVGAPPDTHRVGTHRRLASVVCLRRLL